MNGVVYCATPEQISAWIDVKDMPWVEASERLFVGMYNEQLVCIYGLIPTSIMCDDAYLWLWTAPNIPKIAFGRCAKRMVKIMLEMYSRLICNCFNCDSARWLCSLGAVEAGPNLYIFRRK